LNVVRSTPQISAASTELILSSLAVAGSVVIVPKSRRMTKTNASLLQEKFTTRLYVA
jgi:hypothetical protein